MKKTIFLVIAVLVFSFSLSQAQDPCAACLTPGICTTLPVGDFVPGCPDAEVVVCYTCSPTGNFFTKVEILAVNNVCPGYEDAIWDATYNYIYNNHGDFCGLQPCDQGSLTLEITDPVCYDIFWNGTYLNYTRSETCDLRCTLNLTICMCNCTPDCDTDPDCVPHPVITWNYTYLTGNGECVKEPYGDGVPGYEYSSKPWSILCSKVRGVISHCE